MAKIELKNINHTYVMENGIQKSDSNMRIFKIENLNISWEDGTANALLGPSGCGKTTILNIISGLLKPNSGQVLFNDKNVTDLSPRERHIAQVFQFPVVYDSMNVFDNIAFPLRNDKLPEDEVRKRVHEVAEILELTPYLKYSTTDLGLTEKQKVSLGRGIVRKDTSAVLLDEPLTVIDHKLKYSLRRKLKEVQKILKMTMIYVTHDQHEALTFADHVTLLKDGKIMQSSSPEELHFNPLSPFCGYFIGSPGMNILDCVLKGKFLDFGGIFEISLSEVLAEKLNKIGQTFQLGIRPEYVEIEKGEKTGCPYMRVNVIEDTGAYRILTLILKGIKIKARVSESFEIQEGDFVSVNFPEDKIKIFKDDGRVY